MQSKQQFRNLISRSLARAATAALAMAFVLAFLVMQAAMFSATAYAQTVTFTLNLECSGNCPPLNLRVATGLGQVASDLVPIATVNSDVPGYTQPVPITGGPYGGSLSWTSTPATYVKCMDGDCEAIFSNPGGSASIVGSVFGLPNGSTLLTASFFGGATSFQSGMEEWPSLNGSIDISSINPAILANLGMAGLPNHGSGFLSDSFGLDMVNGDEHFTVSVTFTPSVGTFNVLHSFTGGADGFAPTADLTVDKAGNLYGTTSGGGQYGVGTVFKLTYKGSGWILTPFYSFQGGNDGETPQARVTVGPDGSLYGTTTAGGGSGCGGFGCGTVFKLQPSPVACKTALCPWTETVLYRFSGGSDGATPAGEVVFDHAGNLYGTTSGGGQYGAGTVFELTPSGSGWTESVVYSFTGGADGSNPAAGLIFDLAGNLHGTTYAGGVGAGTVFQLTPSGSGWTEKTTYSFTGGSDGGNPQASLVLDPAGDLYGTSTAAVYELSPSGGGWTFSVLYNLTGPTGALFLDASGNLYGGDPKGGYYKGGSIFKLAPSNGGWTPTLLYQFTGGGDGADPIGVVRDAKGNLYGTTNTGGGYVYPGVVFEITP